MAYTKIVRNRTPSVRNRTGELNVQLPTVYCDLTYMFCISCSTQSNIIKPIIISLFQNPIIY